MIFQKEQGDANYYSSNNRAQRNEFFEWALIILGHIIGSGSKIAGFKFAILYCLLIFLSGQLFG